MASNYRRGADFERRVLADMSKHGYVSVRAAGSHSPADVYSFRYGEMAFIQCKRDGKLPPNEWNELMDWCDRAGAMPILAQAGRGGRGIIYSKLTSRKDGRKSRQPLVPWAPQRGENDGV